MTGAKEDVGKIVTLSGIPSRARFWQKERAASSNACSIRITPTPSRRRFKRRRQAHSSQKYFVAMIAADTSQQCVSLYALKTADR